MRKLREVIFLLNKDIKKEKKREVEKKSYLLEDYYSVNIHHNLVFCRHGNFVGDSYHHSFIFLNEKKGKCRSVNYLVQGLKAADRSTRIQL